MYYYILDKIKGNYWGFGSVATAFLLLMNLMGYSSMSVTVFAIGFMVASMLVVIIIYEPIYSFALNWFCSFFLFFLVYRILGIRTIPLGFLIEGLNFLALIVLMFKGQLKGFNTHFGILLLVWLLVCAVELINPFAASRLAGLHGIRSVINGVVPFFTLYSLLLINKDYVKILLKVWVVLSSMAALYTLYQEFAGFPPWDYKHVTRSKEVIFVVYTFGRFRKISFFDGPMENGIVMAFNAMMCIGMAYQNNIKALKKYALLGAGFLSVWAMIYTGTRTATVIFVFGLLVYIILSRKKELIIMCLSGSLLMVGYVIKTGGGHAIAVMSTSFDAKEDNSMQVRYDNQLKLRTYLKKSPIGFGLGSTGHLGRIYSPNTFLGSFPPDSELVRIVIETGVIGLGIWLFIYYLFMHRALNTLKYKEDDFYDNFKIVSVAFLFMLLLGQYPQEIVKIGSVKLMFSMILAFISVSKYKD